MPKLKKTRNKKYNKGKSYKTIVKRAVRNLGAVFVLNEDKYSVPVNMKTGENYNQIDSIMSDAMTRVPHMWSIMMAVFCVDNGGTQYIKYSIIDAKEPCIQADMDGRASIEHQKLIQSCNENHMIGIGWLATPYYSEFADEDDAFFESIFDANGAWIPAEETVKKKLQHV